MTTHIITLHHVPADKVDDRIKKYTAIGGTNIEKTKENGTFTLKITMPND